MINGESGLYESIVFTIIKQKQKKADMSQEQEIRW